MKRHELRFDRDELSPDQLNVLELEERVWKKARYQRRKAESDLPATRCARREALHADWKMHSDYGVGRNMGGPEPSTEEVEAEKFHLSQAWAAGTRLVNHDRFCSHCSVFPIPAPFTKPLMH